MLPPPISQSASPQPSLIVSLSPLPSRPSPPPRSLGTLDSAKAVYESILDLRVATPQIVLNYASFMLEHKFFEEAFRWGQR